MRICTQLIDTVYYIGIRYLLTVWLLQVIVEIIRTAYNIYCRVIDRTYGNDGIYTCNYVSTAMEYNIYIIEYIEE